MDDKTQPVINSIGNELDNHFVILKYYFIRKAIEIIYPKIRSPDTDTNVLTQQLKEIKNKSIFIILSN